MTGVLAAHWAPESFCPKGTRDRRGTEVPEALVQAWPQDPQKALVSCRIMGAGGAPQGRHERGLGVEGGLS